MSVARGESGDALACEFERRRIPGSNFGYAALVQSSRDCAHPGDCDANGVPVLSSRRESHPGMRELSQRDPLAR